MAKNYYDITLALAGICQAVRLVQQLAHQGECDNDALLTSLNSILQTQPPSALAVFGQHERVLKLGLETLLSMLNSQRHKGNIEPTRYVICLIALTQKLRNNPATMDELARRIGQLERQLTHFSLGSETIQSALAGIYVDVISSLGPRIQVTGSPISLQQPLVQIKIRAALLAGIRSTILWQQVGGSRLQLILSRNRLFKQAQAILGEC